MTRKDYVKIAAILKFHRENAPAKANTSALLNRIASDFADVLATDNPRFDYARFLSAAGYSQGERDLTPEENALLQARLD